MNPHEILVYRKSELNKEQMPVYPDLPVRQTTEAFCFDVTAFSPDWPIVLRPLKVTKVPTGLYAALPPHSSLLVCSRSGLAYRGVQVINAPGVIDSDYRDEICVLLCYIAHPDAEPLIIRHGERIAQFMYIPPMQHPSFVDVDTREQLPAPNSNRRGGFGSTGV